MGIHNSQNIDQMSMYGLISVSSILVKMFLY